MSTAVQLRTIPRRVRLDHQPAVGEQLLLLALREIGRANLPARDLVYSFGRRTNG